MNIGPALPQMLDHADAPRHDLSSITLMTSFNRSDLLERHLKVPCANFFGITETAFPVTRVGKVDKGALRQQIADKLAAERAEDR